MTRERAQILEFRPRSNAPAPVHGSAAVQVETQEPIHAESIDERYKALVSRVRNVADDWIHGLEDVVGALSEARSEGAALRNQNASLGSQLRVSRTLRDELQNQLAGCLAENEGLRLTLNDQAREIARLRAALNA